MSFISMDPFGMISPWLHVASNIWRIVIAPLFHSPDFKRSPPREYGSFRYYPIRYSLSINDAQRIRATLFISEIFLHLFSSNCNSSFKVRCRLFEKPGHPMPFRPASPVACSGRRDSPCRGVRGATGAWIKELFPTPEEAWRHINSFGPSSRSSASSRFCPHPLKVSGCG